VLFHNTEYLHFKGTKAFSLQFPSTLPQKKPRTGLNRGFIIDLPIHNQTPLGDPHTSFPPCIPSAAWILLNRSLNVTFLSDTVSGHLVRCSQPEIADQTSDSVPPGSEVQDLILARSYHLCGNLNLLDPSESKDCQAPVAAIFATYYESHQHSPVYK
jgi:hypothetical protein